MTVADFLEVLVIEEYVRIIDSRNHTLFEGVSQNIAEEFNDATISDIFGDYSFECVVIQIN